MNAAPRSLPLRIEPAPGEALDSWMIRLAGRHAMPVQWLLAAFGHGALLTPWRNNTVVLGLPAAALRRIETQAALASGTLQTAVLDYYQPLGWKPLAGSRYCTACLRESGGQWPIRWRLPHVFACTRHHRLLTHECPACGRTPLSTWSKKTGLLPAHRCSIRPRKHGEVCGTDLLTAENTPLHARDPRLHAQRWINHCLTTMDTDAITDLRDLDAVSGWIRQRPPDTLARHGPAIVEARRQLATTRNPNLLLAVDAAITTEAVRLLTADDHNRYQRFVPLVRTLPQHSTAGTPAAPVVSHRQMGRLSTRLRQQLLAASDPHLPAPERLRYRSCTTAPRLPDPDTSRATERGRFIPQYLWLEWVIRFQPATGSFTDTVATDIPAALLLPGNPISPRRATTELKQWSQNASKTLRQLADHHRDSLTAICILADYLDTHGAPIDYRHRRNTFTDAPIDRRGWEDLCHRADAHPGHDARHLHARRYMFQLLTGADLTDRRHILAFNSSSERATYYSLFHHSLTQPLRIELHEHATRMLRDAGIDEPLTWTPPGRLAAGLDLPGRDPDAINLNAVHRLVTVERQSQAATAEELGVTIDHVRLALLRLHRDQQPHGKNTPPASRRLRERASELLTTEFFDREYIQAGKNLHTIEAETGIHRKLLAQYARQLGIPLANARRSHTVDPTWLRHQLEQQHRSLTDVAYELGFSAETVRRLALRHGVDRRPSGHTGHSVHTRQHPGLPNDIRRAVEGKRHGWLRLRRFQQLAAFTSINQAGKHLGIHTSNLVLEVQRLETDIGAPLLIRTRHRYQPMTLTPRGQALLAALGNARPRDLFNRYAKPLPGWKPDDLRRQRQGRPHSGGRISTTSEL